VISQTQDLLNKGFKFQAVEDKRHSIGKARSDPGFSYAGCFPMADLSVAKR
jgi:hypothetical protein